VKRLLVGLGLTVMSFGAIGVADAQASTEPPTTPVASVTVEDDDDDSDKTGLWGLLGLLGLAGLAGLKRRNEPEYRSTLPPTGSAAPKTAHGASPSGTNLP